MVLLSIIFNGFFGDFVFFDFVILGFVGLEDLVFKRVVFLLEDIIGMVVVRGFGFFMFGN